MLEVDTGKYGAKRQSLQEANPRDILYKLIVTSPDNDEDKIMEECWHKVRRNTPLVRTIFEYWFVNNFRQLTKTDETPEAKAARLDLVKKTAALGKKQIDKIIESRATIKLLSMIMPTGKTLAASSREELLAMGGWTQRVAAQMQPGQTVAAAGLTEKALRQLYEKNNV
jgi:hypothetical protein